jgi:hypothetical protein
MKLEEAIKCLTEQKNNIPTDKLFYKNWLNETSSYIKLFFGENSDQYKRIKQFTFRVQPEKHYYKFFDKEIPNPNYDPSDTPEVAKDFLDSCINSLNNTKSIYQVKKVSFFASLSETAIWTIIGITIPSLISIGLFFGNLYSDKQNIELRQNNKTLNDSLFTLRTFIQNTKKDSTKPSSKN